MFLKRNTDFTELVVWWDENPDFSKVNDVDLAFFIHDYEKRGDHHIKFWTATFDLINNSMEDIAGKFSSGRRRALRGSLENNDLSYEFFSSSEIDNNVIHQVVEGYNSFAITKSLRAISDDFLHNMVVDGKVAISFATYNGVRASCNLYYVGDGIARLYLRFDFDVELDTKVSRQFSAFHIYKDAESFKNLGCKTYDFGGLYQEGQDTTKVEGIINFKRSFGPDEVQIWKNVKILTPKGQTAYEKFFKKRG